MAKRVLFFLFFVAFLYSSEKYDYYDSVNIRKLLFFNENDWEKFVDKKKFYDSNKIGVLCLKEPPKIIEKEVFEKEIIFSLDKKKKEKLSKNYELKSNNYIFKNNMSLKEKKELKDIFSSVNYDKFDYLFIFYNVISEFEKMYSTMNKDLKETYSYGRLSYLFNYKKELTEVKFYYHYNNNSYIFFDKSSFSKFDVYLFGKIIKKGLPYHFSFDSLKFLSSDSFLNVFYDNKIQDETLIVENDYEFKENFIKKVITPSLSLEYCDDGVIDEFGDFVYISNGLSQNIQKKGINCSGFVKDVVDNYIRLKYSNFKWLSLSILKEKRISERAETSYVAFEGKYDPYFGLDWVKNLTDQINQYYNYRIDKALIYDKDVYSQYFPNAGYYFTNLKEVLFRDQKQDSKYFYILVFNRLRTQSPVIPEYYHIAIAVPYFENYHFYIRVFESGDETSFDNLVDFHSKEKVAIFKVPISAIY